MIFFIKLKRMKENLINKKAFDFAVQSVKFCRILQDEKKEYILTKQLIRSSTSVGANLEEGQGAISRADFIHKNHISLKEARESKYWLRLIIATRIDDGSKPNELIKQCEEIIYILTKILITAKANNNLKKK